VSAALLAAALALSTACAPASRAWITEVFYDAAGDDAGLEFVELANHGAAPVALAGARLEAGDGSAPDRWSVRWTGGPGDTVRPGARFVVGGARVAPPPDAVAALDLQNGPDAVRLVWPDGAIEVVGWGPHEFAGYACGAPAADAAPGLSLARVPDDADFGSNALDFRPFAPSPGRANRPARDAAAVRGALAARPARPAPGAPLALEARVWNAGAEPAAAGALRVAFAAAGEGSEWPLGEAAPAGALAPGDTARVALDAAAPPAGRWRLVARAALEGDAEPANDADSLALRVGAGPLEIVEIQFQPAAGEGEWIEVANPGPAPVEIAGWTLSDRGGTRGTVRSAAPGAAVPPGGLAVLAQDRAALLARFPALDSARVHAVMPWPALNNTNGPDGLADAAALAEPDGTPSDEAAYAAGTAAGGCTLERREDGWWPSPAPGGTPLAPPRIPAPLARRFECAPRRVAAGGAVRAGWDLPFPRARARIEAYDLTGRLVARLLPEMAVPARGEREVSLAGLPPGLYVLALVARAEDGATASGAAAVRIAGSAP